MDILDVRHPSTILVVEPDIMLGERILHALTNSGHETIWLPPGSNIDALDLIETVTLSGLYCAVEMSGSFEDWEIGTIFNFYRPDCPVVFATSSGSAPPCLRHRDVFLRKPFAMDRLTQAFALDVDGNASRVADRPSAFVPYGPVKLDQATAMPKRSPSNLAHERRSVSRRFE